MKRIFILSICFLSCYLLSQAQNDSEIDKFFSLSIELKKPNGKIDRDAYVQMTVHNKTDKEILLMKGSNGFLYPQLHSFLFAEVEYKDGRLEQDFSGTCFFLKKGKSYRIPPRGVHQEKVPIKHQLHVTEGTGFLGPKNMHLSKRFRAIIKDFKAYIIDTKYLHCTTLYSNWLDVSNEDFSAIEDK